MKCPQCSLAISDSRHTCPRCKLDLLPYKERLGIRPVNLSASGSNQVVRTDSTAEPAKAGTTTTTTTTTAPLSPPSPATAKSTPVSEINSEPPPPPLNIHQLSQQLKRIPPQPAPNAAQANKQKDFSALEKALQRMAKEREMLEQDTPAPFVRLDSMDELEQHDTTPHTPVSLPNLLDSSSLELPSEASSESSLNPSDPTPAKPLPPLPPSPLAKPPTPPPAITTTGAFPIPSTTPDVLDLSESDELLEQKLDEMIGDLVFDVQAVPVEKPKPAMSSTGNFVIDDDLEISFEVEVDGQTESEANKHSPQATNKPPLAPKQNSAPQPTIIGRSSEELLAASLQPVITRAKIPPTTAVSPQDEMLTGLMSSLDALDSHTHSKLISPVAPSLPQPSTPSQSTQTVTRPAFDSKPRAISELPDAVRATLRAATKKDDPAVRRLVHLLAEAYGVNPQELEREETINSLEEELEKEVQALAEMGTSFYGKKISTPADHTPESTTAKNKKEDVISLLTSELEEQLAELAKEGTTFFGDQLTNIAQSAGSSTPSTAEHDLDPKELAALTAELDNELRQLEGTFTDIAEDQFLAPEINTEAKTETKTEANWESLSTPTATSSEVTTSADASANAELDNEDEDIAQLIAQLEGGEMSSDLSGSWEVLAQEPQEATAETSESSSGGWEVLKSQHVTPLELPDSEELNIASFGEIAEISMPTSPPTSPLPAQTLSGQELHTPTTSATAQPFVDDFERIAAETLNAVTPITAPEQDPSDLLALLDDNAPAPEFCDTPAVLNPQAKAPAPPDPVAVCETGSFISDDLDRLLPPQKPPPLPKR